MSESDRKHRAKNLEAIREKDRIRWRTKRSKHKDEYLSGERPKKSNAKKQRVFDPKRPTVESANGNGSNAPKQNGTPAPSQPELPLECYIQPTKHLFLSGGGSKGYASGDIWNPSPDEEEEYTVRELPKAYPPRSKKLW